MPGRSTCTRCDATLPAPDLDGNQVCIRCGLYHSTDPAAAAPPEPPTPATPPPPPPPPPPGPAGPFGAGGGASFGAGGTSFGIPGTAPPGPAPGGGFSAGPQKVAAPPVRKKRGGVGCLIVVILVVLGIGAAVVGSIVWLVDAVDEASSTGGSVFGDEEFRPLAGEMTILRDAEGGEPEEVVALASRLGSGDRSVVLAELDEEGGDVLWDAALVPDDVYSARFVATDDLVVAGLGRKVVGLDRDTGETAWQADLPDVLSPSCSGCLEIVGGQVVAFTADAQVTVLDPADGTALWARRLVSASGWVMPFDDRLLVIDEPADGPMTVALTEVADGREVMSHAPQCDDPVFEGDTIDANPNGLVLEQVPGTGDVVAQFAFGRGCTTRWEAATGTVRWARAIEQSVDFDADAALTATDMVTSSSQGLIHMSLAEGTESFVAAPADSYLSGPVWLTGTTALATATTTRGTPRALIVAIDVRSREQLWTIDLPQGAEPMVLGDTAGSTLFPGTAAFTVIPSGDALRLLTIEEGGRVTVSDVDPATGRTEIVGTDALLGDSSGTSTAYLESIGPEDAVITVDAAVQVIDLATGTITDSWTG